MMTRWNNPALFENLERRLGAACVAAMLPAIALGQADVDAELADDEIRRYTVEMIIFEYADSTAAGDEIFVPAELPGNAAGTRNQPRSFGDPGSTFAGDERPVSEDEEIDEEDPLAFLRRDEPREDLNVEEIPNHIIQTQLEVLDPREHALKDVYEKLVQLDAYRPIMRAAWTQATFEEDQTLPIRLRRLGNAPLRLDGSVMLYLSRYLHFVVDLTIEERMQPGQASGGRDYGRTRYYGDRRPGNDYGFGYHSQSIPVKYRITEDRLFRNGELRYFDHPKFGVLARVTRVEEEEPATDEMFLLPGNPQ